MVAREHKATIKLSDQEAEMLRTVSEAAGLSASEWIRIQVRLAFDKLPSKKRNK